MYLYVGLQGVVVVSWCVIPSQIFGFRSLLCYCFFQRCMDLKSLGPLCLLRPVLDKNNPNWLHSCSIHVAFLLVVCGLWSTSPSCRVDSKHRFENNLCTFIDHRSRSGCECRQSLILITGTAWAASPNLLEDHCALRWVSNSLLGSWSHF